MNYSIGKYIPLWKRGMKPLGYIIIDPDAVVFKRHECEWVLPIDVARHVKYNPRQLPVTRMFGADAFFRVIILERPDNANETYYLHLSIERVVRGYRAGTTLPPNKL